MTNLFKIEETEISFDLSILEQNEIEISSMPYNYTVNFVSKAETIKTISDLAAKNGDKHFLFVDENIAALYGKEFFEDADLLTLIAEEGNKVLDIVTKVLDKLQEKNFTKKEVFLTIGGGITQDVSAFARAIFKRGINWTYLPTTLLAMADSCIGAKSCLNYGNIKNQLGLFSAPKEVYINSNFLKSLSYRDVLSGYGEIIKLVIVGGKGSIETFEQLTTQQLEDKLVNVDKLIKLALLIKKSVIEIDEFENDIRRALNYGHTVAHAIEPLVNYKIPHGIAVSIGIVIENLIAAQYGTLTRDEATYLNNIILPFIDKESLSYLNDLSITAVIENMKRDKKTMNADIFIAVPFAIGYFDMLKVPIDKTFQIFLANSIKSISIFNI